MEDQISPKEWMSQNNGKSLNDYFKEFPQNSSVSNYSTQVVAHSDLKNEQSRLHAYFPKKKSMLLTVVLTIFFGPFGLFYISFNVAVVMIILPIVVGILFYNTSGSSNDMLLSFRTLIVSSTIFLVMFYPILCVIIGIYKTHKHNQNEERKVHNSKY